MPRTLDQRGFWSGCPLLQRERPPALLRGAERNKPCVPGIQGRNPQKHGEQMSNTWYFVDPTPRWVSREMDGGTAP